MQNFKNMLKQVERDISFCLTEYTFEIIVFLLQKMQVLVLPSAAEETNLSLPFLVGEV